MEKQGIDNNKDSEYAALDKSTTDSANQNQDKEYVKTNTQDLSDWPVMGQDKNVNEANEVGLITSIQVERYDIIKQLATRIKRSVSYLVLYIVLIIANIFVLAWEISERGSHIAVIVMEGLINLIFALEIAVEIVTQGRTAFFMNTWNRVDFTICVFCVIFFVVFCFQELPDNRKELSTFLDGILLTARYLYQIGRLVRFAKKARTSTHFISQDDIIFNEGLDFHESFPRL